MQLIQLESVKLAMFKGTKRHRLQRSCSAMVLELIISEYYSLSSLHILHIAEHVDCRNVRHCMNDGPIPFNGF